MSESCSCYSGAFQSLANTTELGMDSVFAEVSVSTCKNCGQQWLRYFYEQEAFTRSGRWYLGAVTKAQVAELTIESAKQILETLESYYRGGSFYDGRISKRSGEIIL